MALQFYNTLTRRKDTFTPMDAKNVRMYVCGPTVYDRPHLGNARSVVVYDVMYRLLCHIYGKEHVKYVRNITDVDDKINARAKERGITIRALTDEVTAQFYEDMGALNCLRPNVEPRATEHISEMHGIIEKLIANGHAYVREKHVLFDVASAPHYKAEMGNEVQGFVYGMLSHRVQEDLVAGARVEVESYKKNPGDFVLWKPAEEGDDPSCVFDSPWGKGRPGWHIECSAMSAKHLGDTFDLHGGGADLMFPHHENEIAQSRCASKDSEFARMWVHNGFLTVNGEKMSKSLGNFTTPYDLLQKGVKGEVIRFALLWSHYRAPLDWSDKLVEDAKKKLDYLYRTVSICPDVDNNFDLVQIRELQTKYKNTGQITETKYCDFTQDVVDELCDDLNVSSAVSRLFLLCQQANSNNDLEEKERNLIVQRIKSSANLLGLLRETSKVWFKAQPTKTIDIVSHMSTHANVAGYLDFSESYVASMIDARIAAKKAKNWAEADRIRKELAEAGIILEDRPDGTTDWRRA